MMVKLEVRQRLQPHVSRSVLKLDSCLSSFDTIFVPFKKRRRDPPWTLTWHNVKRNDTSQTVAQDSYPPMLAHLEHTEDVILRSLNKTLTHKLLVQHPDH